MLFVKIGSSYSCSELPKQFSNQLYFSENSALGGFSYKSTYSLKYVMTGFETYDVQGREMVIKPRQYLLVNNESEVTTLDAKGKALSIFIAPETLLDVATMQQARSVGRQLDAMGHHHQMPFPVHEKVYQAGNNKTNELLVRIGTSLSKRLISGEQEIEPTLFFQLSEAIVQDQQKHSSRLQNLCSLKPSTVQEQYRRLLIGFHYMNDYWNQPFSLSKTAEASMLSPYHFHRLFKECFDMTPYHYHLKLQMDKAKELLGKAQHSITDISFVLGYNSPTSFGRVFKKYFGTSPSIFQRKIRNKQYL